MSAGLTKAINVNDLVPGIDEGLNEARVILAALVGGSISAVTGGKFANGATTAAIGQAFNGNSFWDKAKDYSEIAITVAGLDGIANCADNGCNYAQWALEVGMAVIPAAKLAKYAAKGSRWAINKLKNHDVKIPDSSCFTAGTFIHTIDGLKPIEDIEVGDMVAAKSDQTGEMEYKPVVRLYRHENKTVLNLTFETANGEQELIQATPEHPFMKADGTWRSASQLAVGDRVQTNGKQIATLKAVATDAKTHKVYNFEVADFHTYFVGEFGIWVHNTDCKEVLNNATEAAQRLGVNLDKLEINNGIAKAKIDFSLNLKADDIAQLKNAMKALGANKAEIDTGFIANEKLDIFLRRRVQDGKYFHGGIVKLSSTKDSDFTIDFNL